VFSKIQRMHRIWQFPKFSCRCWAVWQRNFLVWRKLAAPSILGHLVDPLVYLLAFGFGLGGLLPQVEGMSYLQFLAAGAVCYSTMNCATFEALYSVFSRMHVQRSWDAILNAAMDLDDVIFGELVWSTSKSMLSGVGIVLLLLALNLAHGLELLLILPLIVLTGITFSAMGLVITALSPSYDFFLYYTTLLISPMALLGGVFYPITHMPDWLQTVAMFLPLTHLVAMVRSLLQGQIPVQLWLNLGVLVAYSSVSYYLATLLLRRRLSC